MDLRTFSPEYQEELIRLSGDLPHFAANCLKLVTKQGQLITFKFNQAQWYIHNKIEQQKKRTGKVRVIIVKGRQEGCTTYIQARYFHQTLFHAHMAAYILAHQAESTLKIFGMASRFYENLPEALQFPKKKDTEKSMIYEQGSSYTVGTAGSAQVGRGMTVQLFHGSEIAFYENTEELSTGLMQTVADMAGTEMIFESTANGPGNFFHTKVKQAQAGRGEFELIFVPWYWMDEYACHFELTMKDLTEKELELLKTYGSDPVHPMTIGNLAWRRKKIIEFEDKEWKFNQEYPCSVEEAFVYAEGRFLDISKLEAARKRYPKIDHTKPLIIGVDQGRTGDDTVIARRIGNVLLPFEVIKADDGQERDMRLAGRLGNIINSEKPDGVFIDTTNEHGALDRLHEIGFKKNVKGVHFGSGAIDKLRYTNKRSEMHFVFRDWLNGDDTVVPDDEGFMSECGAIPVEKETSNNLQYIVAKDIIIEKLGWSPNKLDAAILTFAYPVRKQNMPTGNNNAQVQQAQRSQKASTYKSQLSSMKGVG